MADQLSLLSGEEIKAAGLIDGGDDKFLRASTYDLSVGEIIPATGVAHEGKTYALPPGGMVRVISKEVLKLPETITGHVLLKNALCTKGVLAINIGIADPGFEGPISSTLINFGRGSFPVEKGTEFLRVSFLRCPASPRAKTVTYTQESYLKHVRQEVLAYSGPTFLNMDEATKTAADKAFGRFKNGLIIWASLAALVVALLAIFAPLGASLVDKYLGNGEKQTQSQMEQAIEKNLSDRYEARIKALSDQVEELKRSNTTAPGNKNAASRKP